MEVFRLNFCIKQLFQRQEHLPKEGAAVKFESRPIQIPIKKIIIQEKKNQSAQFWAKFCTKSPNFPKIFLNLKLAQI